MVRGKREAGGCCTIPRPWNRIARHIAAALVIACAMAVQSVQAQPANDNCANATVMTEGVAILGSNVNATGTDLTGLCGTNDTTDVWFSWTATCTADVTVSTCGSAFDTTVSVSDAGSCAGFFDFACADDNCGLQTQLIFSAVSGTNYLIRLAGDNGATGNYTITVSCPPIGGCCIGSGVCQSDTTEDDCLNLFLGTFLGAGTDCSGNECSSGACCAPSGCTDVMGSFECTEAGAVYQGDGTTCANTTCPTFGACCGFSDGMCTDMTQTDCEFLGGNYLGDNTDCATDGAVCATGACCTSSGCSETDFFNCTGTFQGGGTTCTGFVCNEDCGSANVVNSVPYVNQIDNSTAADGPDGQFGSCDGAVGKVGKDVWYRWTPATDCEATVSWTPLEGQDNVLIVWQGTDIDCSSGAFMSGVGAPGPNEVDCQECDGTIETCPDDDAPEVSTFFAQAGQTYWFQCGQEGAFPDGGGLSEFSIACTGVTGGCCVGGVCTLQFPTQCEANGGLFAGEGTDCSGGCPGGACCNSDQTCSTAATQSACETGGGVWQGDGVDCMDVICGGACCVEGGCLDDVSESTCLGMGGTYNGNGTLCANTLCNDDCANATVIVAGQTYIGTNVGATGMNESSCADTADVNDVWFTWVAECTDTVTVSLCGGDLAFDTTLAIFDGCGGMEIVCNDDNGIGACPAGTQSLATFDAVSGTQYWIRIAGWNGSQGTYHLLVTCPPVGACCVDGVCSDVSINACNDVNGTFLGQGSDCATSGSLCNTGACCLLDGTCADGLMEGDCVTMNGQYLGGATECSTSTCSPVGACCTAGVCEVTFKNTCENGGGIFLGEGSTCEAGACDGACCAGGSCTIASQSDCVDEGEVFFGPGSACEEVTCPGLGFIPLTYNWNGISHLDERADPDSLDGFRTIGDRGLRLDTATSVGGGSFSVQSGNLFYSFETRPDVVDMIMIGRRSVNNQSGPKGTWDNVVDGDDIGVQPNWDPTDANASVLSSTTTLSAPRLLDEQFELGVLSHGTEGGGAFNMTLTFTDFTQVTVAIDSPDWFANGNAIPDPPSGGLAAQALLTPAPLSGGDGFDAVENHELQDSGNPLNLTQSTVTRDSILAAFGVDVAGKSLESITFDSWTGSTFSAGGIYAVSVAVPGACCMTDGSCIDGLRSDCTAAGGIYLGDGTDCATNGADCAIGACCFTDGTCQDNYQASQCLSEGGFYQGAGTMCATSTCPPTGGCCDAVFACTVAFENNCTSGGGTYLGNGTTCDFGCDCNSNNTLDVFELLPTTDCNANFVLDECETPNPSTVGACCVDEVCSLISGADCMTAGGIYFGDCTDCSQIVCPGPGYVDLNFNWNGVVHPGESNMPDAPDGYRSISDRGMIYGSPDSLGGTTGTLTRGNLTYYMNMLADTTDIIHIGGRGNAWDLSSDGDNVGIRPNWDPSDNGLGTLVSSSNSMFEASPELNSSFELGVLYQAGNGGGNFRMTLGFTDATSISVTINAPDWFANNNGSPTAPQAGVATQVKLPGPLSAGDGFLAAADNDNGNQSSPLNCIEAVVTASSLQSGLGFSVVGRQLNSITFDNWGGSANGGTAIFAATYYNPTVTCSCAGDVSGDNQIDGADVQGFVDCLLGGGGDCGCADVDGSTAVDVGDISDFVTNLLTVGPACP